MPDTKNPLARFDPRSVVRKGLNEVKEILVKGPKQRLIEILFRKEQQEAIEFERRLEAGETEVLSPDDTKRFLDDLVTQLREDRKRFTPRPH